MAKKSKYCCKKLWNKLFEPSRLYCALAITSPRTRRLYNPDEKIMFRSAIVLSDGYYNG